ncbi:MAG: DsrE family protein [Tenericutes bacterium]|nr:DsrE family protein [Mycoplasmatota bacterium]
MDNHLHILWTNDNLLTSKEMVLMYAKNSLIFEFWEKVTVIIWGATAKLVAENEEIQVLVKESIAKGVHFVACKACAEHVNAEHKLLALGVEVKYYGKDLTKLIKEKAHLITL